MKRTLLARLALSAAIFAEGTTPTNSAIFDRDDREYVSPVLGSPYSPVGLVTAGTVFWLRSAGFLADDCHVLTSHMIVGYGAAPVGKRAKFEVGIGTSQYASSKGTIVAGGQIERLQPGQDLYKTGGGDWLLLRLDQCLGARVGHVALRTGPYSPYEFRDLKSAGYPVHRSRNRGITVDPSCRVLGGTERIWVNDCATTRGDAGDPIFQVSNSGPMAQMQVYAMQAYGATPREPIPMTPGLANGAIPMSYIAPQIARFLSTDTAAPLEASTR